MVSDWLFLKGRYNYKDLGYVKYVILSKWKILSDFSLKWNYWFKYWPLMPLMRNIVLNWKQLPYKSSFNFSNVHDKNFVGKFLSINVFFFENIRWLPIIKVVTSNFNECIFTLFFWQFRTLPMRLYRYGIPIYNLFY